MKVHGGEGGMGGHLEPTKKDEATVAAGLDPAKPQIHPATGGTNT